MTVFSLDLMDYAMHRFRTQIPAPFAELMKLGRVNPQNLQEPFLHDGAGAKAVARGQCSQRTPRAREPTHVALPVSR